MATIKSYTDIKQSKKLAEILPLESADGFWKYHNKWDSEGDEWEGYDDYPRAEPYLEYTRKENEWRKDKSDIPCWSLAALIELMPKSITDEYNSKGCLGMSTLYNSSWGWVVYYTNDDVDSLPIHEEQGKTLLEATYKMVVWLLEEGYIE